MRTGQFLRALSADLLQGPPESEHGRTSRLECVTQRFYNPLSITLLGAPVSFASRHCCGEKEERKREIRQREQKARDIETPATRRNAFVSLPLLSCPPTLFLAPHGDVIYSTSDIHVQSCARPWRIRRSDNGARGYTGNASFLKISTPTSGRFVLACLLTPLNSKR